VRGLTERLGTGNPWFVWSAGFGEAPVADPGSQVVGNARTSRRHLMCSVSWSRWESEVRYQNFAWPDTMSLSTVTTVPLGR
jgi:hypothetical protein